MTDRPVVLDCPGCRAPMLVLRTPSRRAGSTQVAATPIEFDRCPACEVEWFDFDELEQLLGAARRTLWVLTEATVPAELCARCGHRNPSPRPLCEQCVQPLHYECPCDETALEARTLFTATLHLCCQCEGVLLPAGHAQKLFDDYRLWLASTRRGELRLEDVYRNAEIVTSRG